MKLRSIFLSTLAALMIAGPALAASLGMVDTKRVFDEYKEAQKSQAEYKEKAESYQREFLEKNRALQEAQRQGKSKAEIEKLTKKYEAELKPRKDAVDALDRKLSTLLKKKIEDAIGDVAKAKGLPVVVDKQVVLHGGEDITDDVLKKLNK